MIAILCALAATTLTIGGTGVDQRAHLQADIDATPTGGTLCLPAGDIDVYRPTAVLPNPDRSSDVRARRAIRIEGQGLGATRLRMAGPSGTSRRLLDVLDGAAVTVTDLTADGSARTESLGEQIHLFHVNQGALTVERVALTLPAQSGSGTAGDCIKVINDASSLVVRDATFVDCDRSGITVHGAGGTLIERVTFRGTGDSDIDLEPPQITLRNLTIRHVDIERTRPGIALAITRVANVVIEDVVVRGGTVFVASASQVRASNLDVTCSVGVCLVVRGASAGLLFRDSSFTGAGGGAVVAAFATGDGAPSNVVLDRVTLVQPDIRAAIEATGVAGLYVTESTLVHTRTSAAYAIVVGSTAGKPPASGLERGNVYQGWAGAVYLQAAAPGVSWFATSAPALSFR